MLIIKSTYFKVLLPMPCSIMSSRILHDLPALDDPYHETAAAICGSIEGIGMASRASPTSSESREPRLPHRKHVARWKRSIPDVCYVFESSGAKIVNYNRFLGIIVQVELVI